MFTDQQAAEGMGTFAGDAALWAAADVGSDDPGHQMFGGSDPLIYLRYVHDLLPRQHRAARRRQCKHARHRKLFFLSC